MSRLVSLSVVALVAVSCGSNPSASGYAFCAELAARICDQQISCNQFASSHRKECIESLRVNLCGVRANEASRGLVKLNEKLTTKCLADLKSTGCTREGTALASACLGTLEPAVTSGNKCETTSHCRDINQACIGAGCDRSCKTVGHAGEPCRPSGAGTGTCDPGLQCDANGTCSRGGATGAECPGALICDPDNYCDNATDKCVALPGNGQACRIGFPSCNEASYCNLAVCATRLASGATCGFNGQCVVGTSCRSGTCQALAAEGAACMNSNDCATGTSCDNVTLTCQKQKRVFYEEACSSTATCNGGLTCRNVKPARAGVAGTAGVCGLPVSGDTCFSSGVCPPGTFCKLPMMMPGEPGTCTAGGGTEPCTNDRECPEAQACHASDRKCVDRAAKGGNCALVSCVATAVCVRRGAAQVCVEPADLAGVCSNDMVQATPCRQPLICARTTCVSAGRRGEPCMGGAAGSCYAGSCLDGLCQDLRPDGASCRQDSDCVSSACERALCVPVCK